MNSITTKNGDGGKTRLYSQETVDKKDPRIWACGDIDELVSMLGITYNVVKNTEEDVFYFTNKHKIAMLNDIDYIQKKLFVVCSEIATTEPTLSKLKERIDEVAMKTLDIVRDDLEAKVLPLPKGFILPGHINEISAYLDMCRAISRRCERIITNLYVEKLNGNKYLLMWMNRLSDYLYLLARYSEHHNYRLVKE